MHRSATLSAVVLATLLSSLTPTASAQGPGQLPLEAIELLEFESLDLVALAKEDAERDADQQPWRFAVPRDVFISPEWAGTWETLVDGSLLWRLRVGAVGAHSLNLGFTEFELPAGATLTVRAADDSSRIRDFTAADNDAHGELWTPVVLADEIVIELIVAPHQVDDYRLVLGRVGQGYRGFGSAGSGSADSGSCNVDVVCPEGDEWHLEIPAIGALQISGFLNCSGVMLNDAHDSLTPWFLTADHCGVSIGSAGSLVVYWNYENSFCRTPGSPASGGPGDGTLSEFTTGSTHRADYSPSDFTLVELDDDPDPAWNISYAGWSRSSADPANVIAIHHPQVEEKRISFENDPTSTTTYLETAVPGDGTHIRVEDWDVGTTEGGSSGSPIFDADHRVVGQLHGGFASCTSQTADWYGRISVSWEGGGSSGSRLKDWLDPTNSGVVAVDTISLETLCDDEGTAEFLAGTVACESQAAVRVVDCGLDTNELVVEQIVVTLASTSEPGGESVVLTETSPTSARFEGSLPVSQSGGAGVLSVAPGDTLTVTYIDADNGQGGFGITVTGNATVDCVAPNVTAALITDVSALGATVDVTLDEAASVVVHYGTSCGSLTSSAASTGGAQTSLSVDLTGLQDETTYFLSIEATDAAGNVTVDDNGGACYSFTTDPATEYFTEEFLSDFDLDGFAVMFTPDPGPDGYTGCVEAIGVLPTDPTGGTVLSMSDDDSQSVAIVGNSVSLYGVSYGSVFVGSNGYITLGSSDSDYSETLGEHFDLPRVAPMYDDFNPSAGGQVSYRQTPESLVVTWENVPQFNTGDSNTFQAELFFDGSVRMAWLGMSSTDGIVGLSAGSGLQLDFIEENLGGIDDCGGLCQTNFGFGGPGSALLQICGGDLSGGTTADLSLIGAPPLAATALFAGFTSTPTAIQGGTLIPLPWSLLKAFVTDGAGELHLTGIAGGGGPYTLYVQCVVVDGSLPLGYAFSNAVEADFLP